MQHDVSLASLTTLGLGGPAKRLVRVSDHDELVSTLASAGEDPVLILGGGSNLVVRDEGFAGLVIRMGIPGVTIEHADGHATVSAGAGVTWDDLVGQVLDDGLAGFECMSGIPGLVGATPMQNVGAYGQEVSDTITAVEALDRTTGALVSFTPAECRFAYRASMFRNNPRYVITRVHFTLPRTNTSRPIRYAELARALAIPEGGSAPLCLVRDTVIRLRRGKGMVVDENDPDSRSAGSFFTNPIVDAATVAQLRARLPADEKIPMFAAPEGMTKLAAGWLIERAGFTKGLARGPVGISSKHALALVHRGGGTTRALLALADEIRAGVEAQLGVTLELEPIVV